MASEFPSPDNRNPLVLPNGEVHQGTVFLKPLIDYPNFEVGDYTYASSDTPPEDWALRLAPHLFPDGPDRLVIGKFCQIAHGVTFITAAANHRYDGFSTYPFAVFDGGFGWDRPSLPSPGPDTMIGNDVWIGREATILPGAEIGDGVIVGAKAVVAGRVEPYSVVVGNPARVVRKRFPEPVIRTLLALAWWTWPIEKIVAHEAEICGGDIDALKAIAP
jgi:virginiamycin A acetyltransferase